MVYSCKFHTIPNVIYFKAKYLLSTRNNKHLINFSKIYYFLSPCDSCQINWYCH